MALRRGAHHIEALGDRWESVVCAFHRGDVVLATEPRARAGTLVEVPVERSEDVGHQPRCRACRIAVHETEQHVAAVAADRDRTAAERELRA